jgi:hypothetical protein
MTPTTRALLAAARAGLDPDPAAAARVRAKLNLALAAPVAAPAATAGLALKLAVVAAIAGAVAVVAIPSHRSRATTVPVPRIDELAVIENPAVRVIAAAPDSAAAPPSAAPVHAHARATMPAPVHPQAAPGAPDIDLAREVQLIDRAMAALRAGHADDALAAIAIYHRETADRGRLTEDATAIDIEASCTLHLDVTAKLAAFDHAWPSSAQRSRLTTACHH